MEKESIPFSLPSSLLVRHDKGALLAATASGDLDLLTAMEATYDILLLETIHKFLVCVFETLCTHRGTRRRPGGATPGKLIVGIRIYHFDQVGTVLQHPNQVLRLVLLQN